MIWWALEAHAEKGREQIASWISRPATWKEPLYREVLASRLMKRYAIAGGTENYASCAVLLEKAPDEKAKSALLESLQSAFEGVPMPTLPDSLTRALQEYSASLGDSGLVLPAGVVWASALAALGFALVWARTDEGVRGFVVPTSTPGPSSASNKQITIMK